MKLCQVLYGHEDPFDVFKSTFTTKNLNDLTADCALLLHGGEDISTSIYNEQNSSYCRTSIRPSYRDSIEMGFIKKAISLNIPIIGICRGAQLICAMDGGSLVQHIEGHRGGSHTITDVASGLKYQANSAHHQMLKLNKKNGNTLLALCEDEVVGYGEGDRPAVYDHVPEVVYFPKMRAIGIQGHPEWMPGTDFTKYCASMIKKYIL